MADKYIDEEEVTEYGDFFYDESAKLEGLSTLLNMPELRGLVRSAIDTFLKEREKATKGTGDLREGRGKTTDAVGDARDVITRFHSHLGSLKADTIDKNAFFEGGNLGDVATVKPATLKSRLETVLLGFSVKKNESFSLRDQWKADLESALSDLSATLSGKEGKRTDAMRDTSAKSRAHKEFVRLYNGVAKPGITCLLNSLGRGAELPLFFKDLQVKETTEDKKAQKAAAQKAAEAKKQKAQPQDAPPTPPEGDAPSTGTPEGEGDAPSTDAPST